MISKNKLLYYYSWNPIIIGGFLSEFLLIQSLFKGYAFFIIVIMIELSCLILAKKINNILN